MASDLFATVAGVVYETLGPAVTVYTEQVEQDLQLPCVIMQLARVGRRPLIGPRAYRDLSLDLVYLTEGGWAEQQDAADKLLTALRHVGDGDASYLGTDLRAETVDGALHVFAQYNDMEVYLPAQQTPGMEGVTATVNVAKEDENGS